MKSERNHECVGFISRMQDRFNIQKSIIVIQKFKKKNYLGFSRDLAYLFPPELELGIQCLQKRLAGS